MSHYFKNNQGFTLIELLVSISIVAVILAVVLNNQSTYTDKAALTGLADEISLAVSQAQIYSIGVREPTAGVGFSSSFGITVSLSASPNGSNSSYIYFTDTDRDLVYDGNWTTCSGECLSRTNITRGNLIEDLCIVLISGSDDCTTTINRVDVSFIRPNTEAQIFFDGVPLNLNTMKGAKIKLLSPGGYRRSVSVFSTGQISVQ